MAHSQFDQFLQEATFHDPEYDRALDDDSFYGLYTSWCYVSSTAPQAEDVFWAAMRQRTDPGQCLRMKGPAAADYILASYPGLV